MVERKHQHLLNVARSLKLQSNLPLAYWDDCILIAAYLINRLPSPLLNQKCPFELLFHKLPSFSHLRVFGCLCFVSTPSIHRLKFDSRANPCVFLEYSFNIKGYKVLNLHTRKVSISRDVFHKFVSPFSSSSTASLKPPLSLPFSSLPTSTPNSSSCPISISLPQVFDTLVSVVPSSTTSQEPPSNSSPDTSSTSSPALLVNTLFAPPSNTSILIGFVPIPLDSAPTVPDGSPSQSTLPIVHADPLLPTMPPLRKSTRVSHKPAYLQAYQCNQISHVPSYTSFPLSSYLSSHKLSPKHLHFCNVISSIVETKFYHQEIQDPKWREAMATEISALEDRKSVV